MISGGATVTFDPSKARDMDGNGKIDAGEIKEGLSVPAGTTTITEPAEGDLVTLVGDGNQYYWKDLKRAIEEAARTHPHPAGGAAENLSPEEIRKKMGGVLAGLLTEIDDKAGAVGDAQRNVNALAADTRLNSTVATERTAATNALAAARTVLVTAQRQLQTMLQRARAMGASDSQLSSYYSLVGESPRSSPGGSVKASSLSPSPDSAGSGAGGTTGASGGNPSPRADVLGSSAGPGAGLFDGLTPPSSMAYANALFMDDNISDGLGQIGKSRREGQRLMMLFFYYARMAESGDLGAMYQFIKFINYIIAKDKAQQNIQISSKLIQLQDLSRKSTEVLMANNPGDDAKSQTEFTKALQKAKSEEATISTSQKLLADMLQEFAQVVETLTNSVKNMLDAWGRVMRNASAR